MSKSDVRKNVKRLFAMFLAFAMVLTLLPAAVMAAPAIELTNDAPEIIEAVPVNDVPEEPIETVAPAAEAGNFRVMAAQSELVTFATSGNNSLTLMSAVPTGENTASKYAESFTVGTDKYRVNYTGNNNTGGLLLTFGGSGDAQVTAGKGTLTAAPGTSGYVFRSFVDKDTITFDKGGAKIEVTFYEAAMVSLTINGEPGSGNVVSKLLNTAGTTSNYAGFVSPEAGFAAPKGKVGEFFEIAGRDPQEGASGQENGKGDKIELNIKPTTGFKVNSVDVKYNDDGVVNLVTATNPDTKLGTLTRGEAEARTYTLFTDASAVIDIAITFGAAPPDTTPTDGKAKGAATGLRLPDGLLASGNAGIYAAAANATVAYEMYVTNDAALSFPGIPVDGKVRYALAGSGVETWASDEIYNGSISLPADGSIIMFYAGFNDWFKVRVTRAALADITVVAMGADEKLDYTYTGAKIAANNGKSFAWPAESKEWMSYAETGDANFVTLVPTTVRSVKVYSGNTEITAGTGADAGKYKVSFADAVKYPIVVTFADLVINTANDLANADDIKDSVVIDLPTSDTPYSVSPDQISGDVTLTVKEGVKLDIGSEDNAPIATAISAAGGGEITVSNPVNNNLSATAGGTITATQTVTGDLIASEGGTITAKTVDGGLSAVGSGTTINAETVTVNEGKAVDVGPGSTISISTALTVTRAASAEQAPAVTVGGNLTIGENAKLDVKDAEVIVDGELNINSGADKPATVNTGSKLTVHNGGTVAIGANTALDIVGNGTAVIDGTLKLSENGKINVAAGAMTFGGTFDAASGNGTITVGGASDSGSDARISGMSTFAYEPLSTAVLTFTKSMEVPANVKIVIEPNAEMVVAAKCRLTVLAAITNDGKIVIDAGGLLNGQTSGSGTVEDAKGNILDGTNGYRSVTIEFKAPGASGGVGLPNHREIVLINLRQGNYVVYQTTTTVDGKQVVFINSQMVTEDDDELTLEIDYSGDSTVTVMIFGGRPDLTVGENVVGATHLANAAQ